MHTVTFEWEKDEDGVYVFANIFGYFLWATDSERVLGSVIPLTQHLFWRNEKITVEPRHELDIIELLQGKTMVEFTECERLRAPPLLIEGEWWTDPEGKCFLVPIEDGMIASRIMDRISEIVALKG